jgi:hypothetical protein
MGKRLWAVRSGMPHRNLFPLPQAALGVIVACAFIVASAGRHATP